MIRNVFRRIASKIMLSLTTVANCSYEIVDYIESIGGRAVMTSDWHERASNHCSEALKVQKKEEEIRF